MGRPYHPGVDTGDEAVLRLVEAGGDHQRFVLLQHRPIPIRVKHVRSKARPALFRYAHDRSLTDMMNVHGHVSNPRRHNFWPTESIVRLPVKPISEWGEPSDHGVPICSRSIRFRTLPAELRGRVSLIR